MYILMRNTYLIKSDNLDMKRIKTELKNWKECSHGNKIDLIYLGHNQLSIKKYWLSSTIKNNISDEKYTLAHKDKLYETLKNNYKKNNYMIEQININFLDYYKNLNKLNKYQNLFLDNKVWIFKPTAGFSGVMIEIFNNYNDFYNYCKNIKDKYVHKWKKMKLNEKLTLGNNYKWVLQEYIQNPTLIKKKKFHFRVYFLYFYKNKKKYGYWIKDLIPIYIAKTKYKNSDFLNKDIHDTHYKTSDEALLLDKSIKNLNIENIHQQIENIVSDLLKVFNPTCFSENKYCFELFGIDFILDKNQNVKIIELNSKIGFKHDKIDETEIFLNIYREIIQPIFEPKSKKKDTIFVPI